MSYDIQAHAASIRAWCMRMLREGGSGWYDYVQAKADALVKVDPVLHGDLAKEVRAEIAKARNGNGGAKC